MVAFTPAEVRIVDLNQATTLTGAELIECVQTTGGTCNSFGVGLSQLLTTLLPTATAAFPGPYQTGNLSPLGGVLFGQGTSVIGITAQGSTGFPLVAGGSTNAPFFSGKLTGTTLGVSNAVNVNNVSAIPSGGATSIGVTFATASLNFGIFFGSGSPTISAATGSIYIQADGTNATSRLFVNTVGTAVWTAIPSGG